MDNWIISVGIMYKALCYVKSVYYSWGIKSWITPSLSLASRRQIFGIFFELNEMIFEHFWVTLGDFWDLLDKYDINNSIEDIFVMQGKKVEG